MNSSECLQIRLYVAVVVHHYGFAKFWKSVCSYLQINDKMLWKYFDEEQARIDKRRKKQKTIQAKHFRRFNNEEKEKSYLNEEHPEKKVLIMELNCDVI